MQRQTIVEKPPWWKPRTGRGLMVIARCLMVLCVALAIGIVVIVSKSGSSDASDADKEVLPSKPEALVRKYFWWDKKMETPRTSADTRPHVIGPVTKQSETTTPKEDAVTKDATRPHVAGVVSIRTDTTTPKQGVATSEPKNTRPFCNHFLCRSAGLMVRDNMDRNANPCDDFYQYACGGFPKHTVIPTYKDSASTFTVTEDYRYLWLPYSMYISDEPDEPKYAKLGKTLYKSCMDTPAIESKGIKPLLSILEGLRDQTFIESSTTDWQKLIYKLENFGYAVNYLIKAEVDVDVENNKAHVIYLDQPELGLPRAFLIDDDQQEREYYRQYMIKIGSILNLYRDEPQKKVNAILSFEMNLAKISSSEDEHFHDPWLNYRTALRELTDKYPGLSWLLTYFAKVFSVDINKDEVVIVKSKKYFDQLGPLLSSTDADVLADYIVWRAVMDSTIYMNDEIRKETFAFKQHLTGVSAQQPRWRECVDVVYNKLPLSAYTMYLERYHEAPDRQILEEVLENYSDAIVQTLQMHDETEHPVKRIARMKKTTVLTNVMNASSEIDMFENLYDDHLLFEDDYFRNGLTITRVARKYMFDKLRKSVPNFDWVAPRADFSTHVRYSTSKNIIDVPIGYVLPPFYTYKGSTHFNYGALGFIISREFAHAFDNNGRRYDQHGNIIRVADEKIDEEYKNLSNCIIKKYENYGSKGANLTMRAVTMQNELFADIAGLKLAYSVYNNWLAKNEDTPDLDYVDEKPRRLFWISAAQTMCSNYKPEREAIKIRTKAYFPDRFRVLGAFSNMPEFSKDFSCPAGSKMNPEEKCTFW